MNPNDIPLLRHPLTEPSAFTAESLVDAVRIERNLPSASVPQVCVLEFDGDLTDWIVASGHGEPYPTWACFHTAMHVIYVDGTKCGIVARTIGGPYAVLVAEQLRASGAKVIFGLTSAGRVSSSLHLPCLVIVADAVRDEGTSYHYLPPSELVQSDPHVVTCLGTEIASLDMPSVVGRVWTTDAPYRETQQQLDEHAKNGVLAVEMQAASLLAFSKANGVPVGVIALVSNAVDHKAENFDKGSHEFGLQIIKAMCSAGIRYLKGLRHGNSE